MKCYLKGNRNPRSYHFKGLVEAISESGNPIQLGRNTTAELFLPSWPTRYNRSEREITVRLHDHPIIRLYPNGVVRLFDCGLKTKTTKSRMDAALQGIGYRLVAINRKWKIYEIATGIYADYFDGITVAE